MWRKITEFFRKLFGRPGDIEAAPLDLNWNTDDERQKSIDLLKQYVEDEAAKAARWYYQKKGSKKILSQILRFSAIILTGLGGLFPIILTIWGASLPMVGAVPADKQQLLVSLFVGLAAVFVTVDKLGGFSTGWIRYIKTAQEIQNSLHEFRMDWELLAAKASYPPQKSEVEEMISSAKLFVIAVNTHVMQETQAWAAEFESNLAQLHKDVKAQWTAREKEEKARLESMRPGVVHLTVTNASETDGGKFTVTLTPSEGQPWEPNEVEGGPDWIGSSVRPGLYTFVVDAKIQGKPARASKAQEVFAGKICEVSLTLPKN